MSPLLQFYVALQRHIDYEQEAANNSSLTETPVLLFGFIPVDEDELNTSKSCITWDVVARKNKNTWHKNAVWRGNN